MAQRTHPDRVRFRSAASRRRLRLVAGGDVGATIEDPGIVLGNLRHNP
jgi:hypothetical protein